MAKDYTSIGAVAQFDPTACWAAALEWWARAIGGRVVVTQINLINLYHNYWDSSGDSDTNPNYGTVSSQGLRTILTDTRWGMNFETVHGVSFTTEYLNRKMRMGPCILGFYESAVQGNHVVAAYGASSTHVACMDPDGGHFRGRPVGHYRASTNVIVGWPVR